MGKKRDYVLEKALSGDLDAIENILGQCYAPLFDMGYHVFGDTEAPLPFLKTALDTLGRQLLGGEVAASSPFVAAACAFRSALAASLPEILPESSPLLRGLAREDALALLVSTALDLEGPERDEVLASAAGVAEAQTQRALADLELSADEFRDRLDLVSAEVALPEGLVDEVVERFEDED